MLRNFSDKYSGNDDKGNFELHCIVMIIEDNARQQWAARVKVSKKYDWSNNRTVVVEEFIKELAREYDAQHAVLTALEDFPMFREKLLEGFQIK
ncbi:hypothetical protein [Neisseria shayeganii]|uniref:Uncharacterized protein n=1 Tax=Neisseria shayeganii TaxID=607712 RepID=A0A7D7S7J8_9NEIS|nr:hypothetical protein [Neisseria shayeganii]QMT40031.1 hypothetical protein H3L94_09260 [Neisseria shayeganii]